MDSKLPKIDLLTLESIAFNACVSICLVGLGAALALHFVGAF